MKVIKSGNSWKRAICNNCDAELSYCGSDVVTEHRIVSSTLNPGKMDKYVYNNHRYIICPECGERIILSETTEIQETPSLIGFTN